jgi:hypothetical protein
MHCITKFKWINIIRDVQIDMDSVDSLPERPTDVSSRLKFVDCDIEETRVMLLTIKGFS